MQKLIRLAALVLTALFATPSLAARLPEGQTKADYLAWLARDPGARAEVLSFKSYLEAAGVEDVVPTWQLVRTASMWRECDGPRFEVARSKQSAAPQIPRAERRAGIGLLQQLVHAALEHAPVVLGGRRPEVALQEPARELSQLRPEC
jgi:hypothetical protein